MSYSAGGRPWHELTYRRELSIVKIAFIIVTLAGAAAVAAGVSAPSAAPRRAMAVDHGTSLVSLAKNYSSLEELKRDSSAIVLARAGNRTQKKVGRASVSVVDVEIDEVLWGEVPSRSVPIGQLGSWEDAGVELRRGDEYLLFLHEYEIVRGKATGLYLVTGGQGAYVRSHSASTYAYAGGQRPADLPQRLTAAQVLSLR